jgi:hypothetical protein
MDALYVGLMLLLFASSVSLVWMLSRQRRP